MSAKTVTDGDETAREAVLRAMQEAAEQVAGKNGVPKGPKGTRGIVILSIDRAWTSPEDAKKKTKKWDEDGDEEGSESPSLNPRNLSFSSKSERAPKSPAKRKKKKKEAWPPRGEDEEEEAEEEEGIHGEEGGDDDDDGDSVQSAYEGTEISLDHAKLYEWMEKWTKEYGLPAVTPIDGCIRHSMPGWHHG